MQLKLSEHSSGEIYHLLTQTIVPRPIAWVLTKNSNSDETYNLAPFSFFNALTSAPPTLVVSIGKKPSGESKDTRANLGEGEHCVVHIPQVTQMQEVSDSAATLDYGDSELERLNLSLESFEGFPLPRIKESPIAFGCKVAKVIEWGETPQALILLEIEQAFVDDNYVGEDDKGRLKIDAKNLNPLARLGANEYASLGDVLSLARPK
ncbi:protein/domain typically associated with flavoprotein oxygenase, DIM6/NTAB family protein [Oleiphilus sp. HI0009]|nr:MULTISPECIES: flavin reductase family protein [unclassified Oleiphilus]KZX76179.1 protein/domain typically associated with flavoprotein oxygenase, DIM6/NTAB family protein [Oleiphilus sp. HI0009]KZX78157.1 protein/domain typically associated with flavoprotein oxygenase, DIM6/NTAB family protein [Oleiphilus sp. HI0009]KZY71883.1 protein/domain typically associated with flavoprotein oxygenase, DIM6/NTAB family protein [Oleiphilus sp. HI0066]KZY75703.1 protein/domain typically associated with f